MQFIASIHDVEKFTRLPNMPISYCCCARVTTKHQLNAIQTVQVHFNECGRVNEIQECNVLCIQAPMFISMSTFAVRKRQVCLCAYVVSIARIHAADLIFHAVRDRQVYLRCTEFNHVYHLHFIKSNQSCAKYCLRSPPYAFLLFLLGRRKKTWQVNLFRCINKCHGRQIIR